MVRIISSFLLFLLSCQFCFAKPVDENTAKTIGYNFYKSEGVSMTSDGLSLIYKGTSSVNGREVTDFYIFNQGASGFVIVSGDDQVPPVLAYSTESAFRATDIPVNVAEWLDNYKNQVNYVIKNNITATRQTAAKWDMLQTNKAGAAKTTVIGVAPLLKTQWNQTPYCNVLCPFDYSASTNVLTGCVATAMAQVMKYWSWPVHGTGSNTYTDGSYGLQSANFTAATYVWDSMPTFLSANNMDVSKIMYDAGVSVNMSYGTAESGSFVLSASSPITNCAEYAFKTYFKYKPSIHGVFRYSYDDSGWVHLIKSEIDASRPVVHTGSGPSGGHCFIADGYTNNDRIHFNWGWGGYCNGYYLVENLAPGTETFNNDQTMLVGIEPNRPTTTGVNTLPENTTANIYPNPATNMINIDLQGTATTQIRILDITGRELKVVTPAHNVSLVNIPVNDLTDGMYLVELQTAQGTITRKVVVAK